jgi:hypothetical protein
VYMCVEICALAYAHVHSKGMYEQKFLYIKDGNLMY